MNRSAARVGHCRIQITSNASLSAPKYAHRTAIRRSPLGHAWRVATRLSVRLSALPPPSSSPPSSRPAPETPAPASTSIPSSTANEGSSNGHPTSNSQPEPSTPWLDALVPIPLSGGYRTRRRDILKVLPLAVAASCLAVVATRSKAFSYTSPAAILAAFVTPPSGPDQDSTSSSDTSRVDAYVRYIAGIEKRGGGQELPDFQRYGDWINSGPLSMGKELKGKVGSGGEIIWSCGSVCVEGPAVTLSKV